MDLNDKVAIVTGSARGIGRAIADKMAAYGATVVISDLRIDDVQRTASDLGAAHPETAFDVAEVDVTQRESAERLARQVFETHGRIDILVNNAGIIGAPGWESRDRSSEDDWDQIYAVNVKGVAKMSDAAAEFMKPRRYGKIVNIASVAGRQGGPGNPPVQRLESRRDQSDPGLCLGTRAAQHQRERHLPRVAVDAHVQPDPHPRQELRRQSCGPYDQRAF